MGLNGPVKTAHEILEQVNQIQRAKRKVLIIFQGEPMSGKTEMLNECQILSDLYNLGVKWIGVADKKALNVVTKETNKGIIVYCTNDDLLNEDMIKQADLIYTFVKE